MKHKCCQCPGEAPQFRCKCQCHRQEDCEYWETLAFIWICDAKDEERRHDAWRRFCQGFPEFGKELLHEFWERILQTIWYKKHGHRHHHRHHHHHEYCQN